MEQRRILFLTNLIPYPLDNGGKIKTHCAIDAVLEMGASVDLIAFNEGEGSSEECFREVYKDQQIDLYTFPGKITTAGNEGYMAGVALRSLLTGRPFAAEKYRTRNMVAMLERLFAKHHYDLVYCDHLQMGVYLDILPSGIPVILDEHNCESELARQRATKSRNPIKKWFLKLEYRKLKMFEARIVNRADKTIVLTKEDKACLEEAGARGDFELIPIGVEDTGVKKYRGKRNPMRLLFLGTLTWEPNVSGIEWFLENVYPCLNNAQLVIAGKGISGQLKEKALSFGAEVLGYVENVNDVYDDCDAMVVPLFMGSGQRVKIIEAFSKGMPVITTSIGIEGIHAEDQREALIADSPKQFVESINIIQNEDIYLSIAESARRRYEEDYSTQMILNRIKSVVASVLKPDSRA